MRSPNTVFAWLRRLGEVATHRHLQDTAHRLDGIFLLMRGNELVLHLDSREKMLTTFFKISRSCRVISSSRLSRRSSSSCAVWCPLPGKACSPLFNQLLAPLRQGTVADPKLSRYLAHGFATALDELHRLHLELPCVGFLLLGHLALL